MARVEITIRGRRHDLVCDDGQEDHLRHLAAQLDERVALLEERVGTLTETRLLVLAGLTLVDELSEAQRRKPPPQELVSDLEAATRRLEEIADKTTAS